MRVKKQKVKTSFALPVALKNRFSDECKRKNLQMSDVLQELLEAWLSGIAPVAAPVAPRPAEISSNEWVLVQKLLGIMRSGRFEMVTSINTALDTYLIVANLPGTPASAMTGSD